MTDELLKRAKGWRDMVRFVVLVEVEAGVQEVAVQLGESRRRWKHVAAALAPIADDIVGARGYNQAGELVGSWDAPPDDDEDEPELELSAESAAEASHRQHTQWVLRESHKMHAENARLTLELVTAVIEVVRALRGSVSTPAPQQPAPESDEGTRTLGLLLQSFMASQNQNQNQGAQDAQGEHRERSPSSDADRQRQSVQPNEAGA